LAASYQHSGYEETLLWGKQIGEQGVIRAPENVLKKLVDQNENENVPKKSSFWNEPQADANDGSSRYEKECPSANRSPYAVADYTHKGLGNDAEKRI
tara:strand:- start:440 stop:730 length:291 start_codon:yes stop_codon:yes gene_type:complete